MKKILALISLVAVLILAACGQTTKTDGATTQTQAAAAEEKSEVTLTNGKEDVTVKTKPKKIVVFDLGVADTIRELGFVDNIAGMPLKTLPAYLKDLPSSIQPTGSMVEPDIEAIAALEPDLIIASGRTIKYLDQLKEIAPTVIFSVDQKDYWNSVSKNTRLVASLFGKEAETKAEEEIKSLEASIKKVADVNEKSTNKKVIACDNINLKIRKGKTLGLVGESGSGKTTLVNMLMDLEKPTSGEILYHGRDISKFTKQEVWENRQNIQIVFQDPWSAFNPKMNVMKILTEPLMNYGRLKRSERKQKAIELLKMVDLPEEFVTKYPQNMSGGQRQRLGIARAISLEPEILICDEATSALDVSIQKNIVELLVKLQKEKNITMIFICHDIALIESFAHEIVVMYHGDVVEVIEGGQISEKAKHPYTKSLLSAIFPVRGEMVEVK